MVRIGLIESPLPFAAFISTMKTDNPSVRLAACSWRRAREQDHQIGIFGATGPDFLAVDDVAVIAVAPGKGLQRGGVGAAGRFGHAERLQPQFAAGDLRQPFCLLLVVAVPQQRAHGVHLGVAAAAIAAGALDLLEDGGCGGQFQPGAAIFFGDQHREISGPRQCIDERAGIGHLAIELAPVFAGELGAQFGDGVANVGKLIRFCCGHRNSAGRSRARMVAVQNAQRVSKAPSLLKTSTEATPIDPDIFRVLARAMSSLPSAGERKLTLISTVTPIRPEGKPEVTAIPAAWSASAATRHENDRRTAADRPGAPGRLRHGPAQRRRCENRRRG